MSALVDLRSLAREKAPALPPEVLQEALLVHALPTWAGRMKNEHGSARVFRHLADQLERAGLEGAAACREFAEEERRHGISCAAVLEALGGEAVFVEEPCAYPAHADASPLEAVVRNVLSICCLSETVAVALIGAERLAMKPGALRDLLESILADEIGHARFGWKLVHEVAPRLSPGERRRLDRYLAVALADLERHQLTHISDAVSPGGLAAELGVCDGRDMRALFYRTAEEVILPRLEDLGFAARAAWDERRLTASDASSASSSGRRRSAPGS